MQLVEKIGTIRNPLTMMAFFGSVAEGIGPAVLPHLQARNQDIYVWFLMTFPILLVILFFITLNFNHKVLYAPSDFKNEAYFLKIFQPASSADTIEKLQEEVREIEDKPISELEQAVTLRVDNEKQALPRQTKSDTLSHYLLVEELVLSKISAELGKPVKKDLRIDNSNAKFIFDGISINGDKVTAIEVQYFLDSKFIATKLKNKFLRLLYAADGLPVSIRSNFSLIIAVVTDKPISNHDQIKKQLFGFVKDTSFPVDIRFFSLDKLQEEFNIGG